jgi:predicted anti-sigma-YlaC factor YlaD
MNCKEVRSSASDYVDGEASSSLTEVIKRHLGLCRDCDGWVKTFATTVGLVRQVPQEEVPESLRQKIREISDSKQ